MSSVKHAEQRLEQGWKQETSIQRGTNMAEEVHKQPPVKRHSVYRSLQVKQEKKKRNGNGINAKVSNYKNES